MPKPRAILYLLLAVFLLTFGGQHGQPPPASAEDDPVYTPPFGDTYVQVGYTPVRFIFPDGSEEWHCAGLFKDPALKTGGGKAAMPTGIASARLSAFLRDYGVLQTGEGFYWDLWTGFSLGSYDNLDLRPWFVSHTKIYSYTQGTYSGDPYSMPEASVRTYMNSNTFLINVPPGTPRPPSKDAPRGENVIRHFAPPDLIAKEIIPGYPEQGGPVPGTTYTGQAKFYNNGKMNGRVKVQMFHRSNGQETLIGETMIDIYRMGEATVQYNWTATGADDEALIAFINPDLNFTYTDPALSGMVCHEEMNHTQYYPAKFNWPGNNKIEKSVVNNNKNLKVENVLPQPGKPKTGATVNLTVDVLNDNTFGYYLPITTDLYWYVDGVLMGKRENITIPGGSRVTLDGFSFKGTKGKHTVKFFVNPNKTKPAVEKIYPQDNVIVKDIYFSDDLDLYVTDCRGGYFLAGSTNTLSVKVGSSQESVKPVTDTVDFYVAGEKIDTQQVTLDPGEQKILTVDWTAPDSNWSGVFKVVVNGDMNPGEITYANNVCTADLRVNKIATSLSCLPDWISNTSLYCYDGNCQCGDCDEDPHYETLTVNIEELQPTTIRAGEGFSFKVITNYDCSSCSRCSTSCEDGSCSAGENKTCPEFGGAREVVAFFPEGTPGVDDTLSNIFVTRNGLKGIKLIPKYLPGSNYNEWTLPRVVITPSDVEKSDRGDDIKYVEDGYILDVGDPYDECDDELEGGHKHYTPFPTKDGAYTFVVAAWGGSEGYNLVDCKQASVTIKSSPYDDFIVRRVHPEKPFPAGIGINWQGHVEEFFTEDVIEFWRSYGDSAADNECWWTFDFDPMLP